MKRRGVICFIFCIIMCSSIDVTLKLTSLSLNAIQLCFWRFLCGGLFCLPSAVKAMRNGRKPIKVTALYPMLFSGFLMVVLSTGLYQVALSIGKASVVSVLYSCSPIFVAVAAWLMMGEKIRWDTVLSSALYLVAVFVLLLSKGGSTSPLSCILILLSAGLLAVYNVLGQSWVERFPPSVYVSFTFIFGAIELLGVIGISHIPAVAEAVRALGIAVLADIPLKANISGRMIPVLLYVGIVATGMNFLSMQVATKELSAITTSFIFYFKLIFAPFLAWLVLGEQIDSAMLAAMVLVFAALTVKTLMGRKMRKTESKR